MSKSYRFKNTSIEIVLIKWNIYVKEWASDKKNNVGPYCMQVGNISFILQIIFIIEIVVIVIVFQLSN